MKSYTPRFTEIYNQQASFTNWETSTSPVDLREKLLVWLLINSLAKEKSSWQKVQHWLKMSFFRGSNWPAVLPQCVMIMMLSKYFLKANLSRIWTPNSFRGKFISTSNAIPGRRLLLDCFCATCQSIIEEDIQRGCYQHAGTLQLTINRVAGENIKRVAG